MKLRFVAGALLFVACSSPPPAPPSAVITATPTTVCSGDDFHTVIQLDSRGSSATLALVYSPPDPDNVPTFAWSFAGTTCIGNGEPSDPTCEIEIDPGSVEADNTIDFARIQVSIRGDRPAVMTLAVTSPKSSVTATATGVISVTSPNPDGGACPVAASASAPGGG